MKTEACDVRADINWTSESKDGKFKSLICVLTNEVIILTKKENIKFINVHNNSQIYT